MLESVRIREHLQQPRLGPCSARCDAPACGRSWSRRRPLSPWNPHGQLWGFSGRDDRRRLPSGGEQSHLSGWVAHPLRRRKGRPRSRAHEMATGSRLSATTPSILKCFQAARIGVAVRPKPALLERLPASKAVSSRAARVVTQPVAAEASAFPRDCDLRLPPSPGCSHPVVVVRRCVWRGPPPTRRRMTHREQEEDHSQASRSRARSAA